MHVAKLELCKELYELSGWETGQWFTFAAEDEISLAEFPDIPQYLLGYLLRKLPANCYISRFETKDPRTKLKTAVDRYHAKHRRGPKVGAYAFAETPEDALCKLAIELLKRGILTKETGSKPSEG